MLIVDAQQNIAFNAQQLERDFRAWAWHQRQRELGRELPPAATSLYDNLLGRIAIVFGSLQVIAETTPSMPAWQRYTWRTSGDAQALAQWQLDHYQRLADDSERIRLILSQADLAQCLDSWADDKALDQHKLGIVILMKGAAPISEPRQLEDWIEQGTRIVAPAWQPNQYISGQAGQANQLSALGYELLEVMASHSLMLDIAGMSEHAAQAALERYEGAVIASHANPRYFHDSQRCLSDELILRLAERGGVMGIMVYNRTLRRDWHPSDPKRSVSVDHWVDAVDYVCQLTGSVAHVGLGSNIDGGYAYGSLPAEIDTSADLWLLSKALRRRGFSESESAAILGGNMLGQLRASLPEG